MAAALRTIELTVPTGVKAEAWADLFAQLHGLARSRFILLDRPHLVVEIVADASRIRTHLSYDQSLHDNVLAALNAALPSVRLDQPEDEPRTSWQSAIELKLSTDRRPLRTASPEVSSTSVLAALRPLNHGEQLALQWVLAPVQAPPPPRRTYKSEGWWLDANGVVDSEDLRARRAKQAEPLFLAAGRLAVRAAHPKRRRQLLSRLYSAVRTQAAPGVSIGRRQVSEHRVAKAASERRAPRLTWPMSLNMRELAATIGLPMGDTLVPGLNRAGARQLPLHDLPRSGVILGDARHLDAGGPIRLPLSARTQHVLCLGPTGVGKTSSSVSAALQDIHDGRGIAFLDPKGDAIEDLLQRIGPEHHDRVVVLDALDEAPVGFNPIGGLARASEANRALAVDQVVGIFRGVFAGSWGIRTEDILRGFLTACVRSSAADGTAWTLADLPQLLTDPRARSRLSRAGASDAVLASFFGWFESLSEPQRAEITAPLLNKLRQVVGLRPQLRRVLGQSEGIDLAEVIRRRQVLLVPLPKGLLGSDAARLLGSLLVAGLWRVAMARSAVPADRRSTFVCYLDEAQNFLDGGTDVGDMLAEARGYGFGLHLISQHLVQWPPQLRDAVLANARTKLAFRLEHDDARILSRSFEPLLSVDDLKNLGAYEIAIRSVAGGLNLTATGTTRPLPDGSPRNAALIRDRSRSTYGRAIEDIDSDLARRVGEDAGGSSDFGPRQRPQPEEGE